MEKQAIKYKVILISQCIIINVIITYVIITYFLCSDHWARLGWIHHPTFGLGVETDDSTHSTGY